MQLPQLTKFIESQLERVREQPNEGFFEQYDFQHGEEFEHRHQAVLLIKPHCFVGPVDISSLLKAVFSRICRHRARVQKVVAISSSYVVRNNLVQRNYPILDQVSRLGTAGLLSLSLRSLQDTLIEEGTCIEDVIGAFEFLDQNPSVSEYALSLLHENGKFRKHGTGSYTSTISLDGRKKLLLNGFYPYLNTALNLGPSLTLALDYRFSSSYKHLREVDIGGITPVSAPPSSLRNFLFLQRHQLGIKEASTIFNFLHCSPGPVESMFQVLRYIDGHSSITPKDLKSTVFGRRAVQEMDFSPELVQQLERGFLVRDGGGEEPIFDLTENLSEDEALRVLRSCLNNLGVK